MNIGEAMFFHRREGFRTEQGIFMGRVNLTSACKPKQQDETKILIEKPPALRPSKYHLSEIVQECLQEGITMLNKPAKYPICPDCGNPSEYLQQEVVDEEGLSIIITSCPACGWIQGMEAHPSSSHWTEEKFCTG
ncbi:MAG: hypothetical protein ACQETR_14605 [Thermodesulfobacteriota bacterium]